MSKRRPEKKPKTRPLRFTRAAVPQKNDALILGARKAVGLMRDNLPLLKKAAEKSGFTGPLRTVLEKLEGPALRWPDTVDLGERCWDWWMDFVAPHKLPDGDSESFMNLLALWAGGVIGCEHPPTSEEAETLGAIVEAIREWVPGGLIGLFEVEPAASRECVIFSEAYHKAEYHGETLRFNDSQAAIMTVLADGKPVHEKTLGAAVNSYAKRYRLLDSFRSHGKTHRAYGLLIKKVSQSVYALVAPTKTQ